MKRPTVASLKKVTAENLAGLGAERLAEILVGVAESRPDLKRRLRMELAAAQGPEHLVVEIDKRLARLQTSRGVITWRQRPAFVRDLEALRVLIAERLAGLNPAAALARLWSLLELAGQIGLRLRQRAAEADVVFQRAAGDVGRLLAAADPAVAADTLVEAMQRRPAAWTAWLPATLEALPAAAVQATLRAAQAREVAATGWPTLIRLLADRAGDVDALRGAYTAAALATPAIAAEVARRYLAIGRSETAGELLRAAAPKPDSRGRLPVPDFDWESAWIEHLEQSGERDLAQEVRWASFERTLSVERAKAFTAQLSDFDDVEAEARAFAFAAAHRDVEAGLRFLMDWPAPGEAARMIQSRAEEIDVAPEAAELWAAKLRRRYPAAAHLLLRRAATAAFRRRDFKTCDRLTQEADSIDLPAGGDQG